MKTHRAFRPAVLELLETRQVPSTGLSIASATAAIHKASSIQQRSLAKIQQAYNVFGQGYAAAEQFTLFGNGTAANPSLNRPAFDAQVQTLVNRLSNSIVAAYVVAKAPATLIAQVQASLTGPTNSLLSQLNAIPSPTTNSPAVANAFNTFAVQAVFSSSQSVKAQLTNFLNSVHLPVSVQNKNIQKVQKAYANFGLGYSIAESTILFAPGTTNPALNRPAFDARVKTLVTGLTNAVTLVFLSSRAAPASVTVVQASLAGPSNSLLAQLAALPSPTSSSTAVANAFNTFATQVVFNSNQWVLAQLRVVFQSGF